MGNERVAITDARGRLSDFDRRVQRQERRVQITSPSDLLGPGFGPTATEINDWADDTAAFTGFYWTQVGALNSPDPTRAWIGVVLSEDDQVAGVQRVWAYRDATWAKEFTRSWTLDGALNRVYTAWIGEGEWQATGITGVASSAPVVQAWKRDRSAVVMSVQFTLGATLAVPDDGNVANTVVLQMPTALIPTACPYVQPLGMGSTGRGQAYEIDNTGKVILTSVAPNRAATLGADSLAAGTTLSVGGVYYL